MANTSATGGYVQPVSNAVPEGDLALDVILQAMVAGITGLAGEMVRPRWQPVQPRVPEADVTWCAVGVTLIRPDDNAAISHDRTGDGADNLVRHEDIELLSTFYGPDAAMRAAMLRDGLQIAQNREALTANGIGFVTAGEVRPVPELVNQQWVRRQDLPITLRRIVRRTYPVLNILSAPVSITQ